MSRILVVDDAAVDRESMARLLTSVGHTVVTAPNGRDAWLTLYEGAPDLILLDLMMPQMDGITFLKLLRHSDHWSGVPVIVITGFSDDDRLVSQARKLGVTDVLPKMRCSVEQILSLVAQTLAKASGSQSINPPPKRSRRALVCSAG